MKRHEYACDVCGGQGHTTCVHCGAEGECYPCGGTGYDATKIDVKALLAAEKELGDGTCTWVENGICVGRQKLDGTARLAFKEFARAPAQPSSPPTVILYTTAPPSLDGHNTRLLGVLDGYRDSYGNAVRRVEMPVLAAKWQEERYRVSGIYRASGIYLACTAAAWETVQALYRRGG